MNDCIALDTETTGIDLHHGSKPFFVTICDANGKQTWWEWEVDPLTREPIVPRSDLAEIYELTAGRHIGNDLVLHNAKFDVAALASVMSDFGNYWPWEATYDTIFAAHLLASNRKKDLTSLAVHWLGVDIQLYEDRVEAAVKEARDVAKRLYPDWRINAEGLEEAPSVKKGATKKDDKVWRGDYWLPKAIAKARRYSDDHPWQTVLSDYANIDSAVTIRLWKVMRQEIEERGLWSIYKERMKLPEIVYGMESRGITINRERVEQLIEQYTGESEQAGAICLNIAKSYNYDLELPKNAVNDSLRKFCFEVMNLEHVRNPKSKTSNPSLDAKNAIPHYQATLPANSKPLKFINTMVYKRSRDTAKTYLESYKRFWLSAFECSWCGHNHFGGPENCQREDIGNLWFRLYPHLNPTGTAHLRWASSNPNEQNISKQDRDGMVSLRYCFGPAPGREWWSMDAKNIELRIPAYESGERELIDLFERPNDPPYYGSEHLLNFHTIYPDMWNSELKTVGFDKVGPHVKKKYASTWYQYCKNFGFSVGYGSIDKTDGKGTADRTARRPGSHAKVKTRFANKEKLNRYWITFAQEHGYVETMIDKEVDPTRGYPIVCEKNEWGKVLATLPLNYHVSGTAMQWMAKAMTRCNGQLREWSKKDRLFDGFISAQIHDELIFDFPRKADPTKDPKGSNLSKAKTLQSLMAKGGEDIGVPTPVSISYHAESWSEGVEL